MNRAQLLFSPPKSTHAEYYSEQEAADYSFRFYPFDKSEARIDLKMERVEAPSEFFYQKELPEDSISKEHYLENLKKVIKKIKEESWQKIVLSRSQYFNAPLSPLDYFNRLRVAYPEAAVYCFSHPVSGTWIGASPEVLLQADGAKARTMSLAGTARNDAVGALGFKEEKEQEYVTDYIMSVLTNLKEVSDINLLDSEKVNAAKLLHIRNVIEFNLSGSLSIESTLDALHPTPAVASLPMKAGLDFIKDIENKSRSFYSGYFGLSREQKSDFYVNLRCLQCGTNGIRLYAGGGITSLSDPLKEWDETNAKMETLARLIDVNLLND